MAALFPYKIEERMRTIMKTKVMGVAHNNADGINRQDILREMKKRGAIGEKLFLEHEKDNPKDPNAVKIINKDGQQIGYLRREYAEDVAKMLDDGLDVYAIVRNITGGTPSKPTLGCNIELPMLKLKKEEEEEDSLGKSSLGCASIIAIIFVFILLVLLF
jgi:hypothetical protein